MAQDDKELDSKKLFEEKLEPHTKEVKDIAKKLSEGAEKHGYLALNQKTVEKPKQPDHTPQEITRTRHT